MKLYEDLGRQRAKASIDCLIGRSSLPGHTASWQARLPA